MPQIFESTLSRLEIESNILKNNIISIYLSDINNPSEYNSPSVLSFSLDKFLYGKYWVELLELFECTINFDFDVNKLLNTSRVDIYVTNPYVILYSFEKEIFYDNGNFPAIWISKPINDVRFVITDNNYFLVPNKFQLGTIEFQLDIRDSFNYMLFYLITNVWKNNIEYVETQRNIYEFQKIIINSGTEVFDESQVYDNIPLYFEYLYNIEPININGITYNRFMIANNIKDINIVIVKLIQA